MPQIVKPWSAHTDRYVQLEVRQKRVKRLANRAFVERATLGEREQRCLRIGCWPKRLST